MVRRSSEVFPEPGELIRFSATMPCSASQARLCAARWSFLASSAVSISTMSGTRLGVGCAGGRGRGRGGRGGRGVSTRTSASPHPQVLHIRRLAQLASHVTDATASSRPASTSTSALPQSHSRIRSASTNSAPQVRQRPAALRLLDLQRRALERRARRHQLEAEAGVRHDARPAGPPAAARVTGDARALGDRSTTLWVIASSCIAVPPRLQNRHDRRPAAISQGTRAFIARPELVA